jgi:hypothetical protein
LRSAAVLLALVVVTATRGIDRGDRSGIVVNSIVWLKLIVLGPLVAIVFRRAVSAQSRSA